MTVTSMTVSDIMIINLISCSAMHRFAELLRQWWMQIKYVSQWFTSQNMKHLLILLFSYSLAEFDTICQLPSADSSRCNRPSKGFVKIRALFVKIVIEYIFDFRRMRMRMRGRMSSRHKKPAVIHLTSNISSIARFIGKLQNI